MRPLTVCRTGKIRYPSELKAKRELAKKWTGPPERRPKRYYQCPFCCGYHLTSKEDKKR